MKAIVLAAGMGKRLQSEKHNMPKVLREVKGRPLLSYVLSNIDFIDKQDTVIVVGYKREMVTEAVSRDYRFAVQQEQLGTGHAVSSAGDELCGYDGTVLVLYGDMPLLKRETYKKLLDQHASGGAACTILSSISDSGLSYGRIIRQNNEISGIVEEKDCTPEQAAVRELNVGVYAFDSKLLFNTLSRLKNDNAQGEYYLTDVPKLLLAEGRKVDACVIGDTEEIYGVNTVADLDFCERHL